MQGSRLVLASIASIIASLALPHLIGAWSCHLECDLRRPVWHSLVLN